MPVNTGRCTRKRFLDTVRSCAQHLQVDAKLATALKRALDRKTQAGYESVDIGAADAESCVKWAGQLLTAAEARLEA